MEQRLSFIRLTGERSADNHLLAEFRCSCGNLTIARQSRVKNGYTRSCGCLNNGSFNIKHGMRNSSTYSSWKAMRQRCLNPLNKDYPRWGGQGVTICDRWQSFENFLADMGERPAGTSLDRINNDKGYSAENCRWATPTVQQRNRRTVVKVKTERGTELLCDYARRLGISNGAAHLRLKRKKLEGVEHA